MFGKNIKILIVTQYFWPENFRINELAVNLVKRGNAVTVLTGIPNYPAGKFHAGYGVFRPFRQQYEGMTVIRCPLVSRGPSKGLRLALNYLSYALSASIVGVMFCLRRKHDRIFVYEPSPITVGIPAILLKKLTGTPVFLWVQDLWPESLVATGAVSSNRVLSLIGKLVGWIYRNSDRILIQSKGFRNQVEGFGIPAEKILYFPNSAEDVFSDAEIHQGAFNHPAVPVGFRVTFAGNIGAAQDFETILEAAEILKDRPEIQFIILGNGRLRDWVQTEIDRRGLGQTFHLLGEFPVQTMPYFYRQSDVLLATLKDDPIFAVTIPGKIQSYLAAGKPILCAVRGEGARVVDEAKAGVTCLPGDPSGLAEGVLKLFACSVDDRIKMGEAGRVYFKSNFEAQGLLDQLETWMREYP